MPPEPYLLKSFWSDAKKIGWRWLLFPVVGAFAPPALLVPVFALVGALFGDGALLAAGTCQKRRAADKKSAAERLGLACESARRGEKERRHTAQWDCEKFYLLHARELEGRLGPDVFMALRKSQLGDHLDVEFVEANARELLDLMRRHLERPTAAAASEARGMVQRYYAEHLRLLRAAFPPALFDATLNAQVPEGAQRDAAWAAARELIVRLQDAVLREETRLQSAGKERQGRERRLRRIDRELAEVRQHLARLGEFGAGDEGAPSMEDEIERQEARVRDLEEERENLLSMNEREP